MIQNFRKDFVAVGTKCTLCNEENNDIFHSVVQSIQGDDVFAVGALTKYGVFIKTPVGTQLTAAYIVGCSGFEFTCEVISNTKMEHLDVVQLRRIGDIVRNQKRESFRVETLMSVKLKVYDMFDVTQVIRTYDTTTLDLSEKGIGVIYDEPLEYNQFVDVYMEIEDDPVVMRCHVARSIKDEQALSGIRRYRIGMSLIEEDENVQKKIRQLVYRLQVKR